MINTTKKKLGICYSVNMHGDAPTRKVKCAKALKEYIAYDDVLKDTRPI